MHIFEQEEENTNTIRCDAKSTRAYSDDDELRNSSSTQKEHETHHNESKNLNAKITSKICKKLFLFDETNTHKLKLLMRNCIILKIVQILEDKLYVK